MKLNAKDIESVVPREALSTEYLNPVVRERAFRIEDPTLRRSFEWAQALLEAFGKEPGWPLRPYWYPDAYVTVGFIEGGPPVRFVQSRWAHRQEIESRFSFGIIVHMDHWPSPYTIDFINIDGLEFPVVVNNKEVALHCTPPHPMGARATCWAKCTEPGFEWQIGILTSGHAMDGKALRTNVRLMASNGHNRPSKGVLVDCQYPMIDAAVLRIPSREWPGGLTQLRIPATLAPGAPAVLYDQGIVIQSGCITTVSGTPGYFGIMASHRITTDFHGAAGESGSLLTDAQRQEGIGIYMGSIPGPFGGTQGIHQTMEQVNHYLKLTPYI